MGLTISTILDVNEGTTPKVTATLTDENGDAVADGLIDSVTVAIHDYNTGTELRAATPVSPFGGEVTSWLTQEETRILNEDLEYEYRVVTIVARYSTSKYVTEEAYIKIANLRHHSVSA